MSADPKTLFARRAYSVARQPITFIAHDAADDRPAGWLSGWFEDGAVVPMMTGPAVRLEHVYTPSWRCVEPRRFEKREAA